jgi:hypothetical protein
MIGLQFVIKYGIVSHVEFNVQVTSKDGQKTTSMHIVTLMRQNRTLIIFPLPDKTVHDNTVAFHLASSCDDSRARLQSSCSCQ